MKIRFEKVEFEVSPQFVEHVAKVFAELEMLQARERHARIRDESQSRQNLIVAVATALIQPLREIIEMVRDHKNGGEDGDGEGGGDGEGSSQPA